MIRVTEYDSSGRFGWTHSFPDQEMYEHNKREGIGYVDGSWQADTHYINNGQPTERPDSPVTIDGRTLSNVPPGSTLWIDGESYEAEGDVELDFVMPGTYKLRVVCFPYLDWEYELVML